MSRWSASCGDVPEAVGGSDDVSVVDEAPPTAVAAAFTEVDVDEPGELAPQRLLAVHDAASQAASHTTRG